MYVFSLLKKQPLLTIVLPGLVSQGTLTQSSCEQLVAHTAGD